MRYFLCRTECRDGFYEYKDAVILELPDSFDVDKYPDYGEEGYSNKSIDYSILNWNYGNAEWHNDLNEWSNDNGGGTREVGVFEFEEITKEDADFLKEHNYLPFFSKEWMDGNRYLSSLSGGVQ
jgi:hypothetical protein